MASQDMVKRTLQNAKRLLLSDDFKGAHKVLLPLLEIDNPEAQLLYSSFSISKTESEDDFSSRRIALLTAASSAGNAEATYQLASHLYYGDFTEVNKGKGLSLYKIAADLGHPKAMFACGLEAYYSTDYSLQERLQGLALIKEAASLGLEEAQDQIANMKRDVEGSG